MIVNLRTGIFEFLNKFQGLVPKGILKLFIMSKILLKSLLIIPTGFIIFSTSISNIRMNSTIHTGCSTLLNSLCKWLSQNITDLPNNTVASRNA